MLKLKIQEAQKAKWEIANTFRGIIGRDADKEEYIIIAAYVGYLLSGTKEKITYKKFIETLVPEIVKHAVMNAIGEEVFNSLKELVDNYSKDVFLTIMATFDDQVILGHRGDETTPSSIVNLANAILSIKEKDKVADIGSGNGGFIIPTAMENPKAKFVGYEINIDRAATTIMRGQGLAKNIDVEVGSCFSVITEKDYAKFDKAFGNYPFGLQTTFRKLEEPVLAEYADEISNLSKATSSAWAFNYLLSKLIKKGGKAVGVMTNGSTWNSSDLAARQYFVENGLIEAVIALPERLFSFTSIPTSMIILSNGNKGVRLIDATNVHTDGRRYNEFTEDNIKTIVKAMGKDTEISRTISLEELRKNEYALSPSRYLDKEYVVENGVPFESIIKRITRGAPFKASDLDELTSNKPTPYQYLMLANIQNGIIDDNLQYLTEIDEKNEKYCINNNSLLLSKNGAPYKVAVASVPEGRKILANGNLYVIDLDEEKVNPYYVKAFFESEMGIAALKSITVGATIPNVGVDKLRKLEIPLPSMEEQEQIANEYQAAVDEVRILRQRLEQAIDRLNHIVDNKREG